MTGKLAQVLGIEMLEKTRGGRPSDGNEDRRGLLRAGQRIDEAGRAAFHVFRKRLLFIVGHGHVRYLPMISVRLTPKREESSSKTITSPRAMTRPLTTISTGSPICLSRVMTAPRPSFIRLATGMVVPPRTTC